METKNNLPIIYFAAEQDFEKWLETNFSGSAGLWIKHAKKDSGINSVTYHEALDIALCYGWIDGQKASYDDKFWLQKFTKRGAKSIWSKVNQQKVEKLIESGMMKEAGFQAIETAKKNGEWDRAYEPQSTITIPDDLQLILDKNEKAKAYFEKLNKQERYSILFKLHAAKKAETRTKHLEKFLKVVEADNS